MATRHLRQEIPSSLTLQEVLWIPALSGAEECEKLLADFEEKKKARNQEIDALDTKKKALDLWHGLSVLQPGANTPIGCMNKPIYPIQWDSMGYIPDSPQHLFAAAAATVDVQCLGLRVVCPCLSAMQT